MSRQLEGRVAIVTGAGRGIGRATAVALAREGADVACVARTASQLAETAALVRAAGRRAQQIEADIGEPGAPSLIAAKVLAELGAIDILVNNAATVEPAGPTATAGPEDWARAVAVNLTGPVRLTLAVLDAMIKQGYGRIVNVSSGIAAAPGAIPGLNAYAASKAALEAHTLGLAAELTGTGVTVNIVRPGPVDTAMPAWILAQPPAQIGAGLHDRFVAMRDADLMASPGQPARMIADLVTGDTTGQIAGPATQPRSPMTSRAGHLQDLAVGGCRPRRHRGHLALTAAIRAVVTDGSGSGRAARTPVLPPHSMRSTADGTAGMARLRPYHHRPFGVSRISERTVVLVQQRGLACPLGRGSPPQARKARSRPVPGHCGLAIKAGRG